MRPPAAQSALPPQYRQPYIGHGGRVGLSAIGPAGTVMTLILIGLASSGCSHVPHRRTTPSPRWRTARSRARSARPASAPAPTESDLAFARNAASDVLTKGDKDSSQPWENPETGARGSVTPLAQAYSSEGRTCRDFLASYVNGASESWLQGAACKSGQGRWEIHTLKPLESRG